MSGFTLPDALSSAEGATFIALVVSSALKVLWLRHARATRDQLFTQVGHVSELYVYPVKSCGAVQLQSATATVTGLAAGGYHDRRWTIQSLETGELVNMKHKPKLSLVTSVVVDDWLLVSSPGMETLRLLCNPDPIKCQQITLNVGAYKIKALDCGKEANEWMSKVVGHPVRLLHSRPDIGIRDAYDVPLDWHTTARQGDQTVFAYLTSYLLTTTASLGELNQRLDRPVTSVHFRPNIVVSSHRDCPFDEDNWEEMRIGTSAKFHYVQPCRRCVITTIDPQTGERSGKMQPLHMLQSYRQREPYGSAPLFGAYIATDCEGPVHVGDPVYVIRRQTST